MTTDPTLESLMTGGHFAIAADRYEEQTGDSELAALMRIDGLEWELLDGVPALKLQTEWTDINEGRFCWWNVRCGGFDFGTVDYQLMDGAALTPLLNSTPIESIVVGAGYGVSLTRRFYQLYCEAVARACS